MMAWGARTPEQLKEAQEKSRIWVAEKPLRDKIANLEARIIKQERIIKLMRKHIKKHGGDDLILDLLEELSEEVKQ